MDAEKIRESAACANRLLITKCLPSAKPDSSEMSFCSAHSRHVWNPASLRSDWLEALKFFLFESFYQGRNPAYSETAAKNVIDCLENRVRASGGDASAILGRDNFGRIENSLSEILGKGKIGKRSDVTMVLSILGFVSGLGERNIVEYTISKIKKRNISDHYYELQTIYQIGRKIASVYLQDLICIYSLAESPEKEGSVSKYSWEEKYVSKADAMLLLHPDRRLKKAAFMAGITESPKEQDVVIREKILKACLSLDVSPIKFSQGSFLAGRSKPFPEIFEILQKVK